MTRGEIESSYAILDLEPGASLAEVKKAYKDLVKIYHPDRFDGNRELQERATAKLQRVNRAYAQLTTALAGAAEGLPRSSRSTPGRRTTDPVGGDRARHARSDTVKRRAAANRTRRHRLTTEAETLNYPFSISPAMASISRARVEAESAQLDALERSLSRWSDQRAELEPLLLKAAELGLVTDDPQLLYPNARRELLRRIEAADGVLSELKTLEGVFAALVKKAHTVNFPRTPPSLADVPRPTPGHVVTLRRKIEQLETALSLWIAQRDEAERLRRQLRSLGLDADLNDILEPGGLEGLRRRATEATQARESRDRRRFVVRSLCTLLALLVTLAGLLLARRLQDEKACDRTRSEQTVSAWEGYLAQRPEGLCSEEAARRIEELHCATAAEEDSVVLWAQILARPGSLCRADAERRIQAIPCESATREDSVSSWSRLLREYPDHSCGEQALRRLREIPCEQAAEQDTVQAWSRALTAEPPTLCRSKAAVRIEELRCEDARSRNTIAAWQSYLADHPQGWCAAEALREIDSLPCDRVTDSGMEALSAWLEQNSGARCHSEAVHELRILRCGARERAVRVDRFESESEKWTTVESLSSMQPDRWMGSTERCVSVCADRCETEERLLYTLTPRGDDGGWRIEPATKPVSGVTSVFGALRGQSNDPFAPLRALQKGEGRGSRTPTSVLACEQVAEASELSCD